VRDGRIQSVAYQTDGCMNTNACANTVAELIEGRDIETAWELTLEDVIDLRFINRILFQFINAPVDGIQGVFQVISLIAQRRNFCRVINRIHSTDSRRMPSVSPANAMAPNSAAAKPAAKSQAITGTAHEGSDAWSGCRIAKAPSAAGHRTGAHGTASINSGHLNHLL
jgi:hypothetical protein